MESNDANQTYLERVNSSYEDARQDMYEGFEGGKLDSVNQFLDRLYVKDLEVGAFKTAYAEEEERRKLIGKLADLLLNKDSFEGTVPAYAEEVVDMLVKEHLEQWPDKDVEYIRDYYKIRAFESFLKAQMDDNPIMANAAIENWKNDLGEKYDDLRIRIDDALADYVATGAVGTKDEKLGLSMVDNFIKTHGLSAKIKRKALGEFKKMFSHYSKQVEEKKRYEELKSFIELTNLLSQGTDYKSARQIIMDTEIELEMRDKLLVFNDKHALADEPTDAEVRNSIWFKKLLFSKEFEDPHFAMSAILDAVDKGYYYKDGKKRLKIHPKDGISLLRLLSKIATEIDMEINKGIRDGIKYLVSLGSVEDNEFLKEIDVTIDQFLFTVDKRKGDKISYDEIYRIAVITGLERDSFIEAVEYFMSKKESL
jgi:hypothetical protein